MLWGLGELGSRPKSLDSLNPRVWSEWSLVRQMEPGLPGIQVSRYLTDLTNFLFSFYYGFVVGLVA